MFTKKNVILNIILSIFFIGVVVSINSIFMKTVLELEIIFLLYFSGLLLSFIGTAIDVHRYKKFENRLNEKNVAILREKNYSENINEIAPAGIFVTDEKYIITVWNSHAEKLTGYKKDEILGKDYGKIAKKVFGNQCNLPEDSIYRGRDLVCREYLINNISQETIFIKKDTKLIKTPEGEIKGMIGTFFDMTEQKLLEAELLELQDKLGLYLDTAKMIFLIINESGKIIMINEKGASILGYTKQELLGKQWFTFLPEKIRARIQDLFLDNLTGEVDFVDYYECEVVKKDGSLITVGWNNSIIKDEYGRVEGVLNTGIDLTDQKQFEELLRYQATIDDMTKLYNRRTGLEMLKKQHSLSRRYHREFTICFMDLNGLKYINDNIGHDAGDEVLKKVAEVLQLSIRDADIACRLGGDEFLVIFPESGFEAASLVVNRMLVNLEKLNKLTDRYEYSISYGFSTFDGNLAEDMISKDITKMVAEADKAMYIMKEKYKNNKLT